MANRFDIQTSPIQLEPQRSALEFFPQALGETVKRIPKVIGEITEPITGPVKERFGAFKKSIAQRSLEPLKKSFQEQISELVKPEALSGLALGFSPIGPVEKLNIVSNTALSKLIGAIKAAKPARQELEKLATIERAKRVGVAGAVLEKVPGEKGFIQAKGKLKGELVSLEKKVFELKHEKLPKIEPVKNDTKVLELKSYINSLEEVIFSSPARQLSKYANKQGELPEAIGRIKTEFGRRGDDIATELGFVDSETARNAYLSYRETVSKVKQLKGELIKAKKETFRDYTAEQLLKINRLAADASRNLENILRKELERSDIETLFIQIQRHPDLSFFEKINTADAFRKILDGTIPQPRELSLLENVFGSKLVAAILKHRNNIEKFKDIVTEVTNLPRVFMTAFDMSAPLRQGIIFTVTKPKIAGRAFWQMFRQTFSEKNYVKWFVDLKSDPLYKVMKESKLYIADSTKIASGLTAKEEAFMFNFAQKIPFLGRFVRASERAYTAYLNKLRVDVFASIASKFIKEGFEFSQNKELFQSLANFINNATGRGSLGSLERNAQVLNSVFFSPRLIASRFNMLNPVWYVRQPKPVRMEAIKSFAEFVGVILSILTLTKLAGADVETDLRSTDFAKIKIGNTRWDIAGGFQQWIRVFAQLISGQRKTQRKEVIPLSSKRFPFETRLDVLARFFRGKLAPTPRLLLELLEGQKLYGDQVTVPKEAQELFMPMYAQDIKEAFEEIGSWSLITVGIPAFFGVGVQTYEERKKPNRFNF